MAGFGQISKEEKLKSSLQKLISHLLLFESEGWVRLLRNQQEEIEKNNFNQIQDLKALFTEQPDYEDMILTHKYREEEEMEPRDMLQANNLKKSLAKELIELIDKF